MGAAHQPIFNHSDLILAVGVIALVAIFYLFFTFGYKSDHDYEDNAKIDDDV